MSRQLPNCGRGEIDTHGVICADRPIIPRNNNFVAWRKLVQELRQGDLYFFYAHSRHGSLRWRYPHIVKFTERTQFTRQGETQFTPPASGTHRCRRSAGGSPLVWQCPAPPTREAAKSMAEMGNVPSRLNACPTGTNRQPDRQRTGRSRRRPPRGAIAAPADTPDSKTTQAIMGAKRTVRAIFRGRPHEQHPCGAQAEHQAQ